MKGSVGTLVMLVLFVGIYLVLVLYYGPQEAIRACLIQGYSDVAVVQKHYIFVGLQGCDEKDAFKWDVQAINSRGQRVNFFVCEGLLFKGATIRSN